MYDFDEVIDREHAQYSYSSKWAKDGFALACFGDKMPEDRIALHVADMDFRCAPAIKDALESVARHGIYGYSIPNGDYYAAIKKWYLERYDLDIDKYHIYHSHGTHKAIEEAVKRLTNIGDKVIVLTPSYSYHRDIDGIGRKMLAVKMKNVEGSYYIDFDEFEKACKEAKAFVLCNPHNPTGKIFSDDELIKLAYVCRFYHVTIISDEVHGDIIRKENTFKPLVKIVGPKGIITCNGINKTFNLAQLIGTGIPFFNISASLTWTVTSSPNWAFFTILSISSRSIIIFFYIPFTTAVRCASNYALKRWRAQTRHPI